MYEKFDSVWDALEDDPVKRENLKLRSELMMNISNVIKEKHLTQQEAAKVLKTTQSQVSKVMNGKFKDFRLDMLVDFALSIGMHVTLKVSQVKTITAHNNDYVK